MEKYDVVVVGAGVSGLTAAHMLLKQGKRVLIIEKEGEVGGLAKTFSYEFSDKRFIVDMGPKVFYTQDPEVKEFVLKILEGGYVTFVRKNAVYVFNRYFRWPISPMDWFKLPFKVVLGIAADMADTLSRSGAEEPTSSFERRITQAYGKTLYEAFFRGYTEKFLCMPAERVHSDWAKAGVSRALKDERLGGQSMFKLIAKGLTLGSIKTQVMYPSKNGFGQICRRLAQTVDDEGGDIRTSATIVKLEHGVVQVKQGEAHHAVGYGHLIWTASLHDLGLLLNEDFTGLRYLSTVFYTVIVEQDEPRADQWIYFGDPKLKVVRVSMPSNIAHYLVPKGFTVLVAEITCDVGGDVWERPENMLDGVRAELLQAGLIKDKSRIKRIFIEKVPNTYPVYDMNYQEELRRMHACVRGKNPKIMLLGRTGAFYYGNLDHSVKKALEFARCYAEDAGKWSEAENIIDRNR